MSRNGSGVYSLPTGNPVVTGTTISSAWANNTLGDIAATLTDSVAADGQTTMTGSLQMGNNTIIGLAPGVNPTDAANVSQVAGRIVQIVQSTSTSTASTSASGSYVSTGHSATITPTSTSSKIFVLCTFTADNNKAYDSGFTVFNGSTNLAGTNTNPAHFAYVGSVEYNLVIPVTMQFLHNPASTSAQTYTVYMLNPGSPSTLVYNQSQGNGSQTGLATITLMEIL